MSSEIVIWLSEQPWSAPLSTISFPGMPMWDGIQWRYSGFEEDSSKYFRRFCMVVVIWLYGPGFGDCMACSAGSESRCMTSCLFGSSSDRK